jgi:hypothetical protein
MTDTKKKAPTGEYSGRLEFNPDTGFHEDGEGNSVVTRDEGKTWHYATDEDVSHIARYSKRFLNVDTTANAVVGLTEEEARAQHPHHFEPTDDDPHKDGLLHDPDIVAEKITSHTEAYKDA